MIDKLTHHFATKVLLLAVVLAFGFTSVIALPAYAALDKAQAQNLLDEFIGKCKVGVDGGNNSRCYQIANSLIKDSGLKCGVDLGTDGGRVMYSRLPSNGKIDKIYSGAISGCQTKISRLPGQTDAEKTATQAEDNAQKACEEFTEQRERDNQGVSVYGACKEGYKAGYTGSKSRAATCNEFSGKRREACSGAYREGNSARPGGSGNDPSNLNSAISYDSLPQTKATDSRLNTIANIAFGIAGSLAMLFVIIGGVRYIMSQGDSQKVKQAKDTILYAVAGLVVTISAFAIVRFVLERAV